MNVRSSDEKQKQHKAFLVRKIFFFHIAPHSRRYKENGSESFGIAVSVTKVNQNSRVSENHLLRGKNKKKRNGTLFVFTQNIVLYNAGQMM